jgi:acetyl-CoA carboxylase biotin carboxyl carrier protein
MDFEEINQILAMMREHELSEFELEHQGFKIRIKKEAGHLVVAPPQVVAAVPPLPAASPAAPAPAASAPSPDATDEEGELELAIVKSPIVGTFFRASEPDARPFAEVGDTVKRGQVLCIIEAMKLMNEIDSEYDGEVVKVYVENGQPVQFGERLFAIKAK